MVPDAPGLALEIDGQLSTRIAILTVTISPDHAAQSTW